jgi:hypothetical protein
MRYNLIKHVKIHQETVPCCCAAILHTHANFSGHVVVVVTSCWGLLY